MQRPEPRPSKRCKQCDREFVHNGRARYCSERCRYRWNLPSKRIAAAAWKVEHPLKVQCHRAVEAALKKGLIVRQPCEICGALTVDAHHESYTDPLKYIRWLCRRHHKQVHRRAEEP